MKPGGWEMRPLGWIVLAVVVGVVMYYTIQRLRRPPQQEDKKA